MDEDNIEDSTIDMDITNDDGNYLCELECCKY